MINVVNLCHVLALLTLLNLYKKVKQRRMNLLMVKVAALQNGILKACEASLHRFSSGNLNAVF